MAKDKQPAIAMPQPTIFGIGKVSPWVKKYNATKITTLFKVFPTAVGTAPRDPRTIFCISL